MLDTGYSMLDTGYSMLDKDLPLNAYRLILTPRSLVVHFFLTTKAPSHQD